MHDFDQTRLELDTEFDLQEGTDVEFEDALEAPPDMEEMDELVEPEAFGAGIGAEPEVSFYAGEELGEAEESALATELLSVTSEQELDYFLGKIFKKVSRFAKSKAGRALGGVLKKVAKRVLPIAGGAVGTFFGGPVGAALGSKLASGAGKIFGLEVAGLSPQDQEFEAARSFVRLASAAARNLDRSGTAAISQPVQVARRALAAAARAHAPGLLRAGAGGAGRSGRWIRRGRRIVLLGV